MDAPPSDVLSIESEGLTTWAVLTGGTHMRINFIGIDGTAHRLQTALDARFPDGSLRFVHQLGAWQIEQAAAGAGLILKLCTPDGFEVAFALNDHDAEQLGAALTAAPRKYRSDIGRPH